MLNEQSPTERVFTVNNLGVYDTSVSENSLRQKNGVYDHGALVFTQLKPKTLLAEN